MFSRAYFPVAVFAFAHFVSGAVVRLPEGLEATGQLGTPVPVVSVTSLGVEASGEGGLAVTGYGYDNYFSRPVFPGVYFPRSYFGGPDPIAGLPLTLNPSGLESTGELGTPVSARSHALSGVEATGECEATTLGYDLDLSFDTGDSVEATGELGTVARIDKGFIPIGLEATGELGTALAQNVGLTLNPGGLEAIAENSDPTHDATYPLAGVEATGELGTPATTRSLPQIGLEATAEINAPTVDIDSAITLTIEPVGLEGVGELGAGLSVLSTPVLGIEATAELAGLDTAVGGAIAFDYSPASVEASTELGTVGLGLGSTQNFTPGGLEASGELGAVPPGLGFTPDGVQARGELGANDLVRDFGPTFLTGVAISGPTITGVAISGPTITEVTLQ